MKGRLPIWLFQNNCVQWLKVVHCNLHSCILVCPEVYTLFTCSILVYGAQLGIEMMTCSPTVYAACYLRMTQPVLVHIWYVCLPSMLGNYEAISWVMQLLLWRNFLFSMESQDDAAWGGLVHQLLPI